MRRVVVAAGLVSARGGHPTQGPFLVSRRPAGTHLADSWEFPGGKVEPGESPPQALVRELQEELGITVAVGDIFAVGHHVYDTKEVILLVYACEIVAGTPACLEVADFAWHSGAEVVALPLPPADLPVVARLERALAATP